MGLQLEHSCSTVVDAASVVAAAAIDCRRCCHIVGKAGGGIQSHVVVAAVVDAVVVLPEILVVATKSCVVDKDTPSDCHVAAGCRGAGADECRSSLRVASCTVSQETHTGPGRLPPSLRAGEAAACLGD